MFQRFHIKYRFRLIQLLCKPGGPMLLGVERGNSTKTLLAICMIPLAVVGPVYDSQLPRHVVMARLGNILARGLGHNFDYTGIKFDATGKIGVMLSEATNPSYTTVVDNSNSQFNWTKSHRENSQLYSYQLQPGLTLNQRLSDITAANLSLSTIVELQDTKLPLVPFNSRQVYFISLAQTFCSKKKMPEVFMTLYEGTTLLPFDRIMNLVSNSEQFAVAFSCALGANMHPEFKNAITVDEVIISEIRDYSENDTDQIIETDINAVKEDKLRPVGNKFSQIKF
ncbi:hypothetical protein J6590_069776 [Homalodisca vitripennis]|nr:hypothetical protein J6590_069776 [Homalodisca vitripennis]